METAIVVFLSGLLVVIFVLDVLQYKQAARDRRNMASVIQADRDLNTAEWQAVCGELERMEKGSETAGRSFQDSLAENSAGLKSIQDALKLREADAGKTEELRQRIDILISEIEGEKEAEAKTQAVFGEGLQNLMGYDMETAKAANRR